MPSRSHMPKSQSDEIPPSRLSSAEWELMELCWRLCPAPVVEIHAESKKTKDRDFNTVSTLLKRMEVKGWLKFDRKQSRPYPCHVQVSREAALRVEIDMFLDEIVGEDPEAIAMLEERLARRKPA